MAAHPPPSTGPADLLPHTHDVRPAFVTGDPRGVTARVAQAQLDAADVDVPGTPRDLATASSPTSKRPIRSRRTSARPTTSLPTLTKPMATAPPATAPMANAATASARTAAARTAMGPSVKGVGTFVVLRRPCALFCRIVTALPLVSPQRREDTVVGGKPVPPGPKVAGRGVSAGRTSSGVAEGAGAVQSRNEHSVT